MEVIEEEHSHQEQVSRTPWLSYLLIGINLLVFIWMVASGVPWFEPTAQHILDWGGSSCEKLLNGGWWRLFTSLFVHFGIVHLGMNMYMLARMGPPLEAILGKLNFIIIYLITGVFGSLLSELFHLNSYCVEAGASGAIFGVIGALTALLSTNLFPKEVKEPHLLQMGMLIAANIFHGLKAQNIGLAAHMGGLFSGLIFGYCFYLSPRLQSGQLIIRTLAVLATALSIIGVFSSIKKSDPFRFNGIVSEFRSIEGKVLELYKNQPSSQMELILFWTYKIKPEIDKMVALSQKMNSLSLYKDKARSRDYLVQWISLTHQRCQLLIRMLKENTNLYLSEFHAINKQIENLSNNFEKDKLAAKGNLPKEYYRVSEKTFQGEHIE